MVVDTEAAVRHQTLDHFIHAFIRDHDRETAADRTMRSRYVPKNIKVQLLAAVRECGNGREASLRICSIADVGLFIDTSCNEIVYYHSITSSVLQWTLSLYVHDTRVRGIIKTVLDDMGRIGDEDIQFMLEKYRYNEEQKLVGNRSDETGLDRVLSFLRPKKFQPSVSYFSYYAQSAMLKLARSVLRNSVVLLNGDVFNIGPRTEHSEAVTDDGVGRRVDTESAQLYEDYRRHAEKLATEVEHESLEKMRRVLSERTTSDEGIGVREPPDELVTAYDQPYGSEDGETTDTGDDDYWRSRRNGENEFDSDRGRTGVASDSDSSVHRTSPPRTGEDLEIETILKRVTESSTSSPTRSDVSDDLRIRTTGSYDVVHRGTRGSERSLVTGNHRAPTLVVIDDGYLTDFVRGDATVTAIGDGRTTFPLNFDRRTVDFDRSRVVRPLALMAVRGQFRLSYSYGPRSHRFPPRRKRKARAIEIQDGGRVRRRPLPIPPDISNRMK